MPKDTFHNLSETKKRKIFDAAVQEFSNRRFSEASINEIIKTAKIPRGSFYQYFTGKEDLYLYVRVEMKKELQEYIHHTETLDPDTGVLETFIHNAIAALELGRIKPEYNRISMLMEKDDCEFIAKIRAISTEDFNRVKDLLEHDKQRGLIKSDTDSGLVIDMIYTLIMKEYFQAGEDSGLFLQRMREIIKIIKKGIET